jgi:hypothetical protein
MEFQVDLKDNLSESAGKMSESIGGLAKSLGGSGGLSSMLDELVPGLGIAAGALAGIAVGMGAVAAAGMAMSVSAVEAKDLMLSRFGQPMVTMFDELGGTVGKTRGELGTMAQQLQAIGIRDVPAMRKALLAASSAEALMGASGSSAFESIMAKVQVAKEGHTALKIPVKALASQFRGMGVDIDDVAKKMGTTGPKLAAMLKAGTVNAQKFGDALQEALIEKGAGPLGVLANGIDALGKRLKENISKLFEDVDIGPFMAGMKDLLSVFDQQTESGRALKFMLTSIFSGLFTVASKVLPYLKKFFLELVIIALKFWIAIAPARKILAQMFADKSKGDALAETMGIMLHQTLGITSALAEAINIFVSFVAMVMRAKAALSNAADAGKAFVDGLVSGIKDAIPNLIAAVGGMVQAAKNKVKSMLGISSPSRVMAEMGKHTGVGLAQGMRGATSEVQGAAAGLANVAAGAASPATAAAVASSDKGGSSITIDVGGIHIGGDGKGAKELTEEAVSLIFERIALAQGL